jgi:hypothetical protein
MKTNRNERRFNENGFRKAVWQGKWMQAGDGRTIRGGVALTHAGEYRPAVVTLYQEHTRTGKLKFSGEVWNLHDGRFAHKEQAIFAAREMVAQRLKNERQIPSQGNEPVRVHVDAGAAPRVPAAQKYGASASRGQDAPQQKRSR